MKSETFSCKDDICIILDKETKKYYPYRKIRACFEIIAAEGFDVRIVFLVSSSFIVVLLVSVFLTFDVFHNYKHLVRRSTFCLKHITFVTF